MLEGLALVLPGSAQVRKPMAVAGSVGARNRYGVVRYTRRPTLGFGIFASVLTNNVATLGALLNGMRPMRKVATYEAEQRHLLELQLRQSGFFDAEEGVFAEEAEGRRDLVPRFRSS